MHSIKQTKSAGAHFTLFYVHLPSITMQPSKNCGNISDGPQQSIIK